jgi:dUTP pyrophosphatase
MTDYFNEIDSIEKAYILGLVNYNNNYIISLSHNDYIINILKTFCPDIEATLKIEIENQELLDMISEKTKEFKDFDYDYKIAFIRGLYESKTYKIELIHNIEIIKDDIFEFINIPYNIINNCITFSNDYYEKKFINKLYNNDEISLLTLRQKKIMLTSKFNRPTIKVVKTVEDAVIPSKAFDTDAGYDLTIIKKLKDFNSKTSLYDTGIKIEIDEGYYTEIVPRSSISKFGYILANNVGIIDNHYRGNLMIALTKIADDAPEIELPFKCCQLIVRKQIYSNLIEITDETLLTDTDRNTGGFGSTS